MVAAPVWLALVGCGGATSPGKAPVILTGRLDRAAIERALPAWRDEAAQAAVDQTAARALGTVPPGATVLVLLGTWCGDSRREVSRLFRALELVPTTGGALPFDLQVVGVGRDKRDPEGLSDGKDLRFVPTLVVVRDGVEVGRIVESAPNGVEVDLGRLLRGEAKGVLTARTGL